jgi:hypothetical protein
MSPEKQDTLFIWITNTSARCYVHSVSTPQHKELRKRWPASLRGNMNDTAISVVATKNAGIGSMHTDIPDHLRWPEARPIGPAWW